MEIILTFRGPRSKKRLRTTDLYVYAMSLIWFNDAFYFTCYKIYSSTKFSSMRLHYASAALAYYNTTLSSLNCVLKHPPLPLSIFLSFFLSLPLSISHSLFLSLSLRVCIWKRKRVNLKSLLKWHHYSSPKLQRSKIDRKYLIAIQR